MTKKNAPAWGLLGTLVAGHAAYWFVGGTYTEHSLGRNLLVVLQLLVGFWLLVRPMWKRRPAAYAALEQAGFLPESALEPGDWTNKETD